MLIYIGSDHAGYNFKGVLKDHMEAQSHEVIDLGAFSEDSVDYPDFIHPVAIDVASSKVDFGIIICGSGNGAAMTANKYQEVRAALCWTKEITELARLHNNANILSIPARYTSIPQAIAMVKIFINTDFEGGRHQKRVDKISCL